MFASASSSACHYGHYGLTKSNRLISLLLVFSPENVVVLSYVACFLPQLIHLLLVVAWHGPDALS